MMYPEQRGEMYFKMLVGVTAVVLVFLVYGYAYTPDWADKLAKGEWPVTEETTSDRFAETWKQMEESNGKGDEIKLAMLGNNLPTTATPSTETTAAKEKPSESWWSTCWFFCEEAAAPKPEKIGSKQFKLEPLETYGPPPDRSKPLANPRRMTVIANPVIAATAPTAKPQVRIVPTKAAAAPAAVKAQAPKPAAAAAMPPLPKLGPVHKAGKVKTRQPRNLAKMATAAEMPEDTTCDILRDDARKGNRDAQASLARGDCGTKEDSGWVTNPHYSSGATRGSAGKTYYH